MKQEFSSSLFALALLLITAPAHSAGKPDAAVKTSIPRIASIGKIKIGYATQEDLAKLWGEGKTITGGHPNSGRLWRIKGTPWILQTDGFDYSKRGLVIDGLQIYQDAKLAEGLPEARLPAKEFNWLGKISPGISQDKVMQLLRAQTLPVTSTKAGVVTSAPGFHALESSDRPLKTWTARMDFTNGTLSRLTLGAS